MKKIFLLFFVFASAGAYAQFGMDMHHKMDSTTTMTFYKNLGASLQKFDKLNNALEGYSQYKPLPEVIASIGFGSIMQKGHFVALNGFTVGYAMNGNAKKKNSTLGFLGINGDAGYDFLGAASRVHVYPTVGLGLEGYRARFNKDVNDVSFDDVLGSNTQQSNLTPLTFYTLFFNYRAGLNFTFQSSDKTSGFGLQLGYTGSFTDASWKINYNQALDNSPNDKLSRLFANLYLTKTLNWGHHHMVM